MKDQLLTTEQAAEALGIKPQTLRQARSMRKWMHLPVVEHKNKLGKTQIRYKLSDIEDFLRLLVDEDIT